MTYLMKTADIYFGLTRSEFKKLAHQFAQKVNVPVPDGWWERDAAGKDWLNGFLQRHPQLSFRKPEPTSIARATAFNRQNVDRFFNLLKDILQRIKVNTMSIWNMDESGFQTVQTPGRVICRRGTRRVGKVTSAERGQLVTLAMTISAAGNSIPPFFVFPRARMSPVLLNGAPDGSVGVASNSGWMNEGLFFKYLEHFKKNTRCSQNDPVLLLVDNHNSHLSIDALDFAHDNGITILSFPPHCTRRMQPLDVSVFGPMKNYYNEAVDVWMTNNPGKLVHVQDIPGLIDATLAKTLKPTTIKSGFRASGIAPFNPHIFTDADFLPSYVSATSDIEIPEPGAFVEIEEGPGPSHIDLNKSLEELRPFPKAASTQKSKRGRPPQKSAELTASPMRRELREKRDKRSATQEKKIAAANKRLLKGLGLAEAQPAKKTKKVTASTKTQLVATSSNRGPSKKSSTQRAAKMSHSSSSEDEDFCVLCFKTMPRKLTKSNSVACISCGREVHLACANMTRSYFNCPNCESD